MLLPTGCVIYSLVDFSPSCRVSDVRPALCFHVCVLQKYHGDQKTRVLVFALYKKEAARLEQSLQRQGWNCVAIHGDKAQGDR